MLFVFQMFFANILGYKLQLGFTLALSLMTNFIFIFDVILTTQKKE